MDAGRACETLSGLTPLFPFSAVQLINNIVVGNVEALVVCSSSSLLHFTHNFLRQEDANAAKETSTEPYISASKAGISMANYVLSEHGLTSSYTGTASVTEMTYGDGRLNFQYYIVTGLDPIVARGDWQVRLPPRFLSPADHPDLTFLCWP